MSLNFEVWLQREILPLLLLLLLLLLLYYIYYYYTYIILAGLLQYVSVPVVQFTPGNDVILQFNISNHYRASTIKTYHWFHKGWCIDCYSYDHYQLDLNNTRLTIINASKDDSGQYEVRVTELDWHGHQSEKCTKNIANVLQHQAVYAPVVYQLTLEGAHNNSCNLF